MVDRIDTSSHWSALNPKDVTYSQEQVDTNPNLFENLAANNRIDGSRSLIEEVSEDLTSLRMELRDLSESAARLADGDTSVFAEREVNNTNPEVVEIEAQRGASLASYEIEVEQLARAQENSSLDLESEETTELDTAENMLIITQGETEAEIAVEVEADDTNQELLERTAIEINNTDLELTAEVINGDETEVSRLEIRATDLGDQAAFEITDLRGQLAAEIGINNIEVEAQPAEYTVDGVEYTAENNEVTLAAQDEVSLALGTEGTAEVIISEDTGQILTATESFIDDYNQALDFLENDLDSDDALALADSLAELVEFREADLAEVGIEVDNEGRLDFNNEEFAVALSEDFVRAEEILGDAGLAAQIEHRVDEALASPISRYVDWESYQHEPNSLMPDFNIYNATGENVSPLSSFQPGVVMDFYL
ncbi:flagellar filament capping protein FliD [Fuchsiella alkaliacetigena]|uniref:flagellar filament capping protein FliD n=1 Tax=Fuchsiella alkaliacetigena TaxID=957042 RepID=UPI00200AE2E1|nr:flagellar filament capping protein FliD [Fuchsiella alkaliacetigena]MCK8824955.1 flagellar filament capping protein FliD [Fuchsiella alkaliacetigena]